VIAVWYVPAYFANPRIFVDEFLIRQNIGRFTGGDQAHSLPFYRGFYFYLPVLLLGMFPWSLWVPTAWPRRVAESPSDEDLLRRYLAAWAAIVFLFFTVSSAKLPHYVLPCCPPLAILIGAYFARRWGGLARNQIRPKLILIAVWLLAVWGIAQFGFEYWYGASAQREAHEMARWTAKRFPGSRVVAYRLSRLNKDLGTGRTEIQETTLPSLSFYLNRDIRSLPADSNADGNKSFAELMAQRAPLVIFTRVGRITPAQIAAASADPEHQRLLVHRTSEHYQVLILLREVR
jgi:hypothetical protein